ncbi:hypothetical protein HJG54_22285 [Leptolyngbya sp. NK1-12]|uniref:Uncharacterized protein n=1 Tax=Leptolyngbya sp. NK1-12 TaxID=2547451 RepID=A0AA96WII5_9CYAN|nr:hypothetical protein [Leptolyngbya sp. NK1-12]WNZ25310.1 hypothetical protein HJG54_22285 [Leptolyngbya sp. NK1-12]
MSGTGIQGWDVAIELDETALNAQISSFFNREFRGSTRSLDPLPDSFSSIRAAIHIPAVRFIQGNAQQLRADLIVNLNDVSMFYTTIGQLETESVGTAERVRLNLENSSLEVNTTRFTEEVRNRLAAAGVTVAEFNEFRTALIGVVIGGVVGAAVGVVAANIVQEITRTIANMSITGTARGLVGTPLFPLPLLSPSELMTQNVLLDDLVIVSRLEVAYVNLRGELRITDRQYLSTSAPPFNRVRLTWKGTFEAVPVHLTPPFRFLWTVNGVRLYYEGEIPVTQGTLRYRVDGSRCTLTTTHGTMLNEMLCVEVTDARGIWMLACKALRAEGERTEVQEINPRDEALISRLFRLPPHLIPGPAPDVIFNPKIAAQIQADYVSAVARGMSVDPGSL